MPSSRNSVPDKTSNGGPNSQLDIYQEVIDSTDEEPFLSRTNFGLGNYTEREMWMQTEAHHRGMYATAAFKQRLEQRARRETIRKLGERGWTYTVQTDNGKQDQHIRGWNDLPEEERNSPDEPHRRTFIKHQGRQIWDRLPEREKRKALEAYAGLDGEWTAPHYRQMVMRHEASRSRGARLLDNLFDRVREVKGSAREAAQEMLTLGGDQS